ncbi:MAG TPA: tetratricopeptide repeat protein [Terriglobia bacterium]|nr:tetratricopeptide repeat protein [Terriglobia bacterium]
MRLKAARTPSPGWLARNTNVMVVLFLALLAAAQAPAIRARTIGAQSAASQGQQAQSQSILKRAQQFIGQGNLEGARAELIQGLKSFPRDAAIYNFLGVVEAQENNLEAAEKHFRQAIALDPRYAGASLNLGHLYQSEIPKVPGAASLALATYLKLLQFDPENAEANYQAAVLEAHQGDYQKSLDHLKKLPAADRQKPQALVLLCVDLARTGHPRAASDAASRFASSPDLTEQDVLPILPELKSQNALVIQLLSALSQRHLASPGMLYKLVELQEQAGLLKQARQNLETVAKGYPGSAAPLIDLARLANQQHDYRGALGYLAHARDLEPKNAAVHFFFGIVCIEMDLHQEAYVSLKKAVNLDPANAYYNYAFGAVASQRDDPREAIPYFKKYCALRPSDPRGPLSLGAAYYYSHDLETSRNELLKVAGVKATAAGANYFLGRIAYDDDNLPDAGQYLTTAIRDDPEYADAYAALGGVYLNQKKYGHAEESLLRALKIDPTNYLANLNLTVLYQRTKDKRAAEQAKRFAALQTQREQRAKLFLRTIRVVP